MKTIDIVVPCYNEQEVIAAYYEETSKHVAAINNYSFRYIFVNDGSRDNTLLLLKGLAADHDDVRYVSFSRNFGKEAAMFAGLKNTTADYVICLLYTSDAADEEDSGDLGGRRHTQKKKKTEQM